jgi:hypothetical protein
MLVRRQIGIFGAALLFGVSTTRVSSAQDQGTVPSASETEPAKHKLSSRTDPTPGVNATSKTPQETRMGLVGRFLDDQRTLWTSPARLRFSDTEWLVQVGSITAGLFVRWRFLEIQSDPSTNVSPNVEILSQPQKMFRHERFKESSAGRGNQP